MEKAIIFTKDTVMPQVERMLAAYPDLYVAETTEDSIEIDGNIIVHRTYNDYTIRNIYDLKVIIPLGSENLPYVIDSSKYINETYPHIYTNRMLCLETDIVIRIRFIEGFDLVAWMDEYVEPYFFSYEYYMEFGQFPFGERSHGALGLIESYKELLHASDLLQAKNLAEFMLHHNYRGHHDCPCGSGLRIRNCHGIYMLPFYKNNILMTQLAIDLYSLENELNEYKKRKNTD